MKKRLLCLILLMTIFLTSCGDLNYGNINKTYKPKLMASPINGLWTIESVIESESRNTNKVNDEFMFNIDFFASKDRIYLDPEFEIVQTSWKDYVSQKRSLKDLSNLVNLKDVNIVEIKKDGTLVAEVVPITYGKCLLFFNNELVELKRQKDTFSEAEKNEIKVSYSQKDIFNPNNTWTLAIGLRSPGDLSKDKAAYQYETLILNYKDRLINDRSVKGILIDNGVSIDRYDVKKTEVDKTLVSTVFLNGSPINILNVNPDARPKDFRINYLSDSYLTIENIYETRLNTLNTYQTNNREGLHQLRIEDIVDFSYDRIIDVINTSNTEATFLQTVYNIGITRENGYTVLKGRVPTLSNNEVYNRDFIISSNFSYVEEKNSTVNFQSMKGLFPNIVDAYSTPIDNEYVIIYKNSIEVVYIDRASKTYAKLFSKDLDMGEAIVSLDLVDTTRLNELEGQNTSYRGK